MRPSLQIVLILTSCFVMSGCVTPPPHIMGVVFPKRGKPPCTDLQKLQSDPKVTLSDHAVISAQTMDRFEQDHVFTKPPYTLWKYLKPKLRDGDQMYFMQYNDVKSDFVMTRWYFFRKGCAIAVIPWGSS